MKKDFSGAEVGTKSLWAGEEGLSVGGATQVPIVQSIAFAYEDMEEWQEVALGQKAGHIYSRNSNPTYAALEEKVRILEGAEAATCFADSSGCPELPGSTCKLT